MRAAGGQPFQHLLPAPGCLGRGPVSDGLDRPAVPGDPLLWVQEDEGLAGPAWYAGEPEAGAAADACHGAAGHLPAASHQPTGTGATGVPLPAEGYDDHPAQPEPAPAKAGVWAADITYLPMARGFLYLVAIMDWHSQYVLAWRL